MKAVKWRRPVTLAVIVALALAVRPAYAGKADAPVLPSLPPGLPELPKLGETMQRNLASGLALNGYDPVAYHAERRAVPGRPDYELSHGGAIWRFASAANREAFRDAPEVYEPAFAGFDPTGVAAGRAVESDPRQFAVIGARLFLFRTADNRARFIDDPAQLSQARAQWQAVYGMIAR